MQKYKVFLDISCNSLTFPAIPWIKKKMRGVKIYFFAFKYAIFGKIWHKFEILSWRYLMLKISTFRLLPLIQTYIFIILCLSYFKLGH